MIGKFKVVHLIGSTKQNEKVFKKAEEYFTQNGYIVFKPVFYGLRSDDPKIDMYNSMCYEKLLFSDIVCIVTPNHIGKSTCNRIKQAISLNKEIVVYENDNVTKYNYFK